MRRRLLYCRPPWPWRRSSWRVGRRGRPPCHSRPPRATRLGTPPTGWPRATSTATATWISCRPTVAGDSQTGGRTTPSSAPSRSSRTGATARSRRLATSQLAGPSSRAGSTGATSTATATWTWSCPSNSRGPATGGLRSCSTRGTAPSARPEVRDLVARVRHRQRSRRGRRPGPRNDGDLLVYHRGVQEQGRRHLRVQRKLPSQHRGGRTAILLLARQPYRGGLRQGRGRGPGYVPPTLR